MSMIKYNFSSIDNVRVKFADDNAKILENTKKIDDELSEISNIVSTPKSYEVIPKFVELLNEQGKYMEAQKKIFEGYFTTINQEYQEYLNSVKERMGGFNDKL